MMSKVRPEIKARIKALSFEQSGEPQPGLLIQIPNNDEDVDYVVTHETDEFTSLCPLNTAQPDHANIVVEFIPDKFLVELKSLKYYFTSFRSSEIFHEQVPPTILRDLVKVIEPKWIKVIGEFTVRGGLKTTVVATWTKDDEVGPLEAERS